MPVKTTTGFSFIDTYNIIKEDMQTSEADYEDDLDPLDQTQQGVPQFSFSSSSSTSSPASYPTTQTTTTVISNSVQQHLPSPYSSPAPSPTPSYSSPSPFSPPTSQINPPASGQQQQQQQNQNLLPIFLDMDMNSIFLDELMGQPAPSGPAPVIPVPSPTPATTPPPPSTTPCISTNFVAEAATAGCTVVQTSTADLPGMADQQLLEMDVVDFYDLDKQCSFYDDSALLEGKVKEEDYWAAEFGMMDMLQGPQRDSVPEPSLVGSSPPSLTELGPVGMGEQEDLLSALDNIRRDIAQDCKRLGISADPKTWSAQDSQSWVRYVLEKAQRSDDCSASLAVPGSQLFQKSEEQLVRVSPSSGSYLRQQMEIWMVVADFPEPASVPSTRPNPSPQQLSPMPGATHGLTRTNPPPSVSPAPSTDSVCSLSSGSSSSLSSSTSSLSSDAEMSLWGQDSCGEEDSVLFHDSNASLTLQDQPRSRKTTPSSTAAKPRTGRPGKQIRLWEFLRELLELNDPSMKWLDRKLGIFKIEDSNRVATLWGTRKNHPAMNYDKLSRSVRQYYKKGIIKKTVQTRRLVYQFCERYL